MFLFRICMATGLILCASTSLLLNSCSEDLNRIGLEHSDNSSYQDDDLEERKEHFFHHVENPMWYEGKAHNDFYLDAALTARNSTSSKEYLQQINAYSSSDALAWLDFQNKVGQVSTSALFDSLSLWGLESELAKSLAVINEKVVRRGSYDLVFLQNAVKDEIDSSKLCSDPALRRKWQGSLAVLEFSYAMHGGQHFDGIDYSIIAHNPTQVIPDEKLPSDIWMNIGEIAIADAIAYAFSFNSLEAAIASLAEFIGQLNDGDWQEFFDQLGGGLAFDADDHPLSLETDLDVDK